MELCLQLRMLFIKDSDSTVEIASLHSIINETLDKSYTEEQVILGMDYAGFERKNDSYLVKIKPTLQEK